MNWLKLALELLPLIEEIVKSISAAAAGGKNPQDLHTTVVAHVAALPAKISG